MSIDHLSIGRFGYKMFGISMFVKHTYSQPFHGLVQIVRHKSHILRYLQTSIASYHGYKGLSSIGEMIVWIDRHTKPRYTEDILDTKYSIYKHYMGDTCNVLDMFDIRFERFDMKV